MKFISVSGSVLLAATLVSCASGGVNRGSVAMKVSDTTAHVGMGGKEVKVGDHLLLFKNECSGSSGRASADDRSCKKVQTGHGSVSQVLSNDYSAVVFPAGTNFAEGDTLEKHGH